MPKGDYWNKRDRPKKLPFSITGRGGGGGGKGGGGRGSGSEAPNTLRASQYIHLIDLLGEGPIVGLVDGLKSVIVDGVPLQNQDNTYNIKDCKIQLLTGLPDQDPLKGFPDVESEVSVGVELRYNVPIVRTILDTNTTSVRVTLQQASLANTNKDTGAITGSSVKFIIELATVGGSYTTMITDTISGKTTSQYARSYLMTLDIPGPWNVRVTRKTVDSDLVTLQDQSYWQSFTQIIDHKLTYGDSAVAGVRAPAKSFSSIPSRLYELDQLIIPYPSNWDPVTRLYTGVWDGTFITSNHAVNNTAWVLYEIINNDRWGLRRFAKNVSADKWTLYSIAQYCDELVPDGFGGMEPRYTFNGVFASADDAIKVLQNIASTFRGMVWWGAGNITFTCDMPEDPIKIVTPANVIGGSFDYATSGLKTRHTAALVTWFNPELQYSQDIEVYEDQDKILQYGYNPIAFVAIGCTSRGQAHRAGRWTIDTEWSQIETVTYKSSWDQADVRPGNIIEVMDPSYAGIRAGGRIAAVAMSGGDCVGITLDAEYVFLATTYFVKVVMPDGTLVSKQINESGVTTDTITFTSHIVAAAPLANAVWLLYGDVSPRQFRVLTVKEASPNEFDIIALFHDPTKYDRIEQNLAIDPPVYTTLPTGALILPTELAVSDILKMVNSVPSNIVTISWKLSKDPRIANYQVQYLDPADDVWKDIGITQTASIESEPIVTGTYQFRVRGIDFGGRTSDWLTTPPTLVDAMNDAPSDVTGFDISVLGDYATLTWDQIADLNWDHYILKYSDQLSGVTWTTATILVDNVKSTSLQVATLQGTFLIKAVTNQDKESTNAAIITSNVAGILAFNEVATVNEEPDWTGTKIDTETSGGTLYLASVDHVSDWTLLSSVPVVSFGMNGYADAGSYQWLNAFDLSEAYTSRITSIVTAYGSNAQDVMSSWNPLSAADPLATLQPGSWDISLFIRTTTDDPASMGAVWTPWKPFVIGDYFARGIEMELDLSSVDVNITPVVTSWHTTIDMPDRVVAGNNLSVGLSGLAVAFDPAFKSLGGLAISAQGLATGDYYTITGKDESGFTIAFFNASNAPITRTFDYVAKGYGRVS